MATKAPITNCLRGGTPLEPDLAKAAFAAAAMMILAKQYGASVIPVIHITYGAKKLSVSTWQAGWELEPGCREIASADQRAIKIIGEEIGQGFRDGVSLRDMVKRLELRPELILDATKDLLALIVSVIEDVHLVAHYAQNLLAQAIGQDHDVVLAVLPRVKFC